MTPRSERRWSVAADVVLGGAVLAWVLLLGLAHPPATLRVVVPLIVVVVVVHRVLMLVEDAHRPEQGGDATAPAARTAPADDAVNAA